MVIVLYEYKCSGTNNTSMYVPSLYVQCTAIVLSCAMKCSSWRWSDVILEKRDRRLKLPNRLYIGFVSQHVGLSVL